MKNSTTDAPPRNNGAQHDAPHKDGTTPDQLAAQYGFSEYAANGSKEWHGANPTGNGATKDGYILNADGTSYDRELRQHFTSTQTAENFGIAPEDFSPVIEWRKSHTKTQQQQSARTIRYDYHDENGTLLYQVERRETGAGEKTFSQRRPDGRGGWLYSFKGGYFVQDGRQWKPAGKDTPGAVFFEHITPRLYCLPDVLKAKSVFVVEGEKAADAGNAFLKRLGLYGDYVFTTSHGGAGKFYECHAQDIAGKQAAIFPDNDTPGHNHAQQAAQCCKDAGAMVSVVELPGLPHKGDVADFLSNGGTIEKVIEFAQNAPEWKPLPLKDEKGQTEEKPQFEIFTYEDMKRLPRSEWLVRRLLIEGTVGVVSGDSQSFKTFFTLWMSLSVASGRPFFGNEVKQGNVVYVAPEGFYTLHDRITAWGDHHRCEIPSNFHALRVPVNVSSATVRNDFRQAVSQLGPVLIVLDTLSQCAEGLDENSNSDMAKFISGMMELAREIGATVIVVHHNGKNTGVFRGAGAIKNNADFHISLERPDEDQLITLVRCEKQRGRPFENFALQGHEVELPHEDEFGDPVTTLVFDPTTENVGAKPGKKKSGSAIKAEKTRAALMEVFDQLQAKWGSVKIGAWKSEAVDKRAEQGKEEICSASSFWTHRKTLACVIRETEPGSGLFVRSTPTTPTTPSENNCSSRSNAQNSDESTPTPLQQPLGVGVVGVKSEMGNSLGLDLGAEENTQPKQRPAQSSKSADSEPYSAERLPNAAAAKEATP